MAEEEQKAVPIEVTTDESKTAQDLEAEIAATAAALGDPKTPAPAPAPVAPEPTPTPEKPTATKKTADASAGGGQKVQIKKRPTLGITSNEPAPKEGEAVSIPVTKKAPSEGGSRVIAPLSKSKSTSDPAADEPAEEKVEESPAPTPDKPEEEKPEPEEAKKTIADEAEEAKGGTDSDSEDSSFEAARKLNALSGELKQREEDKKEEENQQQNPKVYDTKQYHLPIKASHHHRKAALPIWARALVLIVALMGALGYAYANDIISFGGSGSETTANPTIDQVGEVENSDDTVTEPASTEIEPATDTDTTNAPTSVIVEDRFSIALDENWSRVEDGSLDENVYRYNNQGSTYIELRFGPELDSNDTEFNVFWTYSLSEDKTKIVFDEFDSSDCLLNIESGDDNCSEDGQELTIFGAGTSGVDELDNGEIISILAGTTNSDDAADLDLTEIAALIELVDINETSASN